VLEIDPKIRILIVSGDPELALACKLILKRSGLNNITTIESGIEALKTCESTRFEVILCDKNTKHLSGWLFIQEFKNSPKILNSAIVYFGGTACEQKPEVLAQYGVLGYAAAPINNKVLMSLLASSLGEAQQKTSLEHRYSFAKEALVSKDANAAVERYSALSKETKQNVRSSVGLLQSYEVQGNVAKVGEVAAVLAEKGADTPTAVMAIIRSMCTQSQFDTAKEKAHSLVDTTKETAIYFSACVDVFNRYQKFALSEEIAIKAQKAGFRTSEFAITVARGRFTAGQIEESVKILKRTEKEFGPSLEGLNLLGVCLRRLNQFEESKNCYEKALKLSPMDAKVYFNLALSETFLDHKDIAIRHLETCLKIAPDFDKARVKLSELMEIKKTA
jgi:tetratricopeptide (TPR) repeat protein